mmetsp:Transcript_13830/g.35550  ORF Transcript_13830/g.35550 Transcript_13830/m.35550 type:complete len:182 (-) Transcript_13830:1237-1782(-)
MADAFAVYRGELVGGATMAIGRFDSVDKPQGLAHKIGAETGAVVAVVNPARVPDELVLLVAGNKAVHAANHGRLKTSTVGTEVLYMLSPTTNIAAAISAFGPAELAQSGAAVIVCVFDPADGVLDAVAGHVGGVAVPRDQPYLERADLEAVAKIFKLSAAQMEPAACVDAVVTKLAIKQPC